MTDSTTLDWRRHRTGRPRPCRVCGRQAVMRDETGAPCHKVCAEAELDETIDRHSRR